MQVVPPAGVGDGGAATATTARRLADRWAVVAFAETEHPELDLLTPPKRPERK